MYKLDQNSLNKFQATVNGMDLQQLKITNMLLGRQNQDSNIQFQRCLYILSLEERTIAQARQLQNYFEKQFQYISQIRGQLDDDLYLKLFKNMMLERIPQFQIIFEQGEKGRKMYFILDGEVGILIPNDMDQEIDVTQIKKFEDFLSDFKLIAIKKKSDHFGEIAIEQRVPRTATAIARTDCIFATLSYESYQSVLGLLQEQIMQHKIEILQQIAPFKHWSNTSQYVFLHNCEEINYQNNIILYFRYNIVDYIYIIIEGEILVQKWEQNTIQTLGLYSNGQVVGDYEIYINKLQCPIRRCSQAKCSTQTRVLRIPILQFIENLKNNQNEEWLIQYYDDKFNKKWLNRECIQQLRNSIQTPQRNQYILPNNKQKSIHILRKISQPLQLDETICYSPQQSQQLRKCNSNIKLQSSSLHYILQNMKKRVQNYQDRFQSVSGIYSVSLQRRRCQSRQEKSFQTYLLKPSTCKMSIQK